MTQQPPFVGTLATRPSTASAESRAGITMAMLELSWRRFEPSPGEFSDAYARSVCDQLAAYRAAGMQVTLGLGMHYTPQWLLDEPGSRMIDQTGRVSRQIDLVFNERLRAIAQRYLTQVDQVLGLQNFWAIRITAGGTPELFYPGGGGYWAFSAGAQNKAGRPSTLAPNPEPGYRPGSEDPTLNAQAAYRWARWYVTALADVADWQMRTMRGLGFRGWFQLLTPGKGIKPTQLGRLSARGLPTGLLGRGAAWAWVYDAIEERANVLAHVTSVADGSGGDDVCRPDDDRIPLESDEVLGWSATRWLSRIARANGFPVTGEIPGYPREDDARRRYADPGADGLVARARAQVVGCGLVGLYWAHDDQLWDGTVPLSQVAALAPEGASPPPYPPSPAR